MSAEHLLSLSHGENRGSSPLGSANDFKGFLKDRALVSRPCPARGGGPGQGRKTPRSPRFPVGAGILEAMDWTDWTVGQITAIVSKPPVRRRRPRAPRIRRQVAGPAPAAKTPLHRLPRAPVADQSNESV